MKYVPIGAATMASVNPSSLYMTDLGGVSLSSITCTLRNKKCLTLLPPGQYLISQDHGLSPLPQLFQLGHCAGRPYSKSEVG
jgi:hypothetical protein